MRNSQGVKMKEIVTDQEKLHIPTKQVPLEHDIKGLVSDLLLWLKDDRALGMAANQLGADLSVIVFKLMAGPPVILVNPVITKEKGQQRGPEGCLSVPETVDKPLQIVRPKLITVTGLNQYYKHWKMKLRGFEARICCHEVDHLKGILITDLV
jgi:peptide deformylase